MKREKGYEKIIFKENCKFCFYLLICFFNLCGWNKECTSGRGKQIRSAEIIIKKPKKL